MPVVSIYQLLKVIDRKLVLFFHRFTLFIAMTASFLFTKLSDLQPQFFCFYFFLIAYRISNIFSPSKLLSKFDLYLPIIFAAWIMNSSRSVASLLAYFLLVFLKVGICELFSVVAGFLHLLSSLVWELRSLVDGKFVVKNEFRLLTMFTTR